MLSFLGFISGIPKNEIGWRKRFAELIANLKVESPKSDTFSDFGLSILDFRLSTLLNCRHSHRFVIVAVNLVKITQRPI